VLGAADFGAVDATEAAEDSGCCAGFSTAELGAEALVTEVVAVEIAAGCVWFSLTGELGESKSFDPDESFVRFFFKKPRVGIEALKGGNVD
jgi:hypothetical protein